MHFSSADSLGSMSEKEIQDYVDEINCVKTRSWEHQYLHLVQDILDNGDDRIDRTGVGTRALFGKQLDIDLKEGFPAVTTKKLAFKGVKTEDIFFISGSSDERFLCELVHGTRDASKRTIWTDNANADYWKDKAQFPGDLGRVYGVQWRHWKKYKERTFYSHANEEMVTKVEAAGEVDQLAEVIHKLKTNPTDRRMIISAWNPAELDQMALPPCHMMAQFFVAKGKLSCQMYQRSVDTMLGLPFNIASYALLTHMIAQVCGLGVDRLIMNLGDVHIYSDHLEGAAEQVKRIPLDCPTLELNPAIMDIDEFFPSDINLVNYQHHDPIDFKMAV